MKHEWVVALGLLAGACNGKPDQHPTDGNLGPTGVVVLQATAINAGSAATTPRLVSSSGTVADVPAVPLAPSATHTIDPSTFRVHDFISAPASELKIRIVGITAFGEHGSAVLFGAVDPSGQLDMSSPGVELALTSGPLDLAAAGLVLKPIPVGHYTGIQITTSRAVKVKGCVTGTFNAMSAMSGTFNGVTYTTDAVSAGTHQFCTIAAKSLLNFENGTGVPSGPVGSDAEYEAQTSPEETELDIGALPAASAAEVRAARANINAPSAFDVDATNPVQLTLVVDMNRMLRFWPNTRTYFTPPEPQGYPAGTSYFFNNSFGQSLALFVGEPGSIEGYQINSEVCQIPICSSAPPDLSREWMTVIRDTNGDIRAGMIAPDDAPPAIYGDLVPPLTTAGTDPGTLRVSVGLYRDTIRESGYIDGFRFKNLGDPEDSCSVYPIMGNGPVDGHGPFPFWYTRRL